MKKLQISNIIVLIILIILFIVSLTYVGKAGFDAITKNSENGLGDYLSLIVLVLEIIIIVAGLIYFSIALSFYNSNKEETGMIKTACWINIIAFVISILFIILITALGQSVFQEETKFMLSLIAGTGTIWGVFVQGISLLISFLLFVIGYTTAAPTNNTYTKPQNSTPLIYSGN